MSDGGDSVRNLQRFMRPNAEHVLDYFHVAMRLTVLQQLARGLPSPLDAAAGAMVEALESVRHYIWHGNVKRAVETVEELDDALDLLEGPPPRVAKLRRHLAEFIGYIVSNAALIPNYGERPPLWRGGLDRLRREHRQSGNRQALRQKAADAVDQALVLTCYSSSAPGCSTARSTMTSKRWRNLTPLRSNRTGHGRVMPQVFYAPHESVTPSPKPNIPILPPWSSPKRPCLDHQDGGPFCTPIHSHK